MPEFLLGCFFSVVSLMVLVVGLVFFWQWFYYRPTDEDETSFVHTDDGWRLAVHRYRPASASTCQPVILCHGLSSNRFIFDLPEGPSLAKYLSSRGLDVWVAELRGSGRSDRPRLLMSDVPYSWDFEDHLKRDLPAVVEHVMERTQAKSVHWVGHSMGGMLLRAHLGTGDDEKIASAVTVGSPIDFTDYDPLFYRPLLKLRPLARLAPIFPFTFIARLFTPVIHLIPDRYAGLFNCDNIDRTAGKRTFVLACQLVTSSLLWADIGRFMETGVFGPSSGGVYLPPGQAGTTPILVLGGSKDVRAPLQSVMAGCEEPNRQDNLTCHIFGKDTGTEEEYGHADLLVGLRVEREVFPRVLQWIEEHDPSREGLQIPQ